MSENTTLEFADAEPIQSAGPGRKAGPNPYSDIIASIALKTKEDGKTPIAKAFTATHEADGREKAVDAIRRKMSAAGDANDPKVTVKVVGTPVMKGPKGRQTESNTETLVTFWTVTKQSRPRKATVQTASTDQSVAAAS